LHLSEESKKYNILVNKKKKKKSGLTRGRTVTENKPVVTSGEREGGGAREE